MTASGLANQTDGGSSVEVAILPPVTSLLNPNAIAIGSLADQVTETALILPADLERVAWFEIGERFSAMYRGALLWWIGDWLEYGIAHFDLDAETAAEQTDFDATALKAILQVARAFAPDRRRETLSFWKHAEVVSLPPELADHWLDECIENAWTRDDLRAAIRPPKERAAIEIGSSLDVVRVMQRRVASLFPSAVVESDSTLLLNDRWAVTITDRHPA